LLEGTLTQPEGEARVRTVAHSQGQDLGRGPTVSQSFEGVSDGFGKWGDRLGVLQTTKSRKHGVLL
jgi:hypothetical protein